MQKQKCYPKNFQFFVRPSGVCKVLRGCCTEKRESYSANELTHSPFQPFFFIPLPHNPILHVHDTSFSFLSFQNKRVTITTEARWRATGCVCLSSGLRRWRGFWLCDCWRRSSVRSSPFVLIYKSAFVWNCYHEEDTQCAVWDSNNKQDSITMGQGGLPLLVAAEMKWTMNWSQLY